MNDAAAIALFSVLVTIQLGGHGGGASAAAVTFVRQFAGGLIFGYLCARVVASLFSWLQDFRLAQVSLTVALPYLAYIGQAQDERGRACVIFSRSFDALSRPSWAHSAVQLVGNIDHAKVTLLAVAPSIGRARQSELILEVVR